jgi:hypothetical protein
MPIGGTSASAPRGGQERTLDALAGRHSHLNQRLEVFGGIKHEGSKMLDVMMLAIGLGFFVLALAYVNACDRL